MKSLIIFTTVVAASIFSTVNSYEVPTARVELLRPRGFRVSIPDSPGVELFAFHGSINRRVEGVEAGDYSADVHRQRDGRWTYTNPTASLSSGDTLYFWIYVQVYGRGYQRLYQQVNVV